MKTLSIGSLSGASNTCLHRNWALELNSDHLDAVNTRVNPESLWARICNRLFQWGLPISRPSNSNENQQVIELIDRSKDNPYDLVWIDKGLTINISTLVHIKNKSPKTVIVSYSPDNMALRHNQSQNFLKCIPFYDIHFTTKSYIIDDLRSFGAKKVVFTNKHYEQSFHYPRALSEQDRIDFGGDVGFIGNWEAERCESILFLASNGVKVRVFGNGNWNDYHNVPNLTIEPAIYSEDYSKALQAFRISLCFLRKMNFDQQTSRTMEIPACGGFMLGERTDEHLSLFEEGVEAEFFSSNEELLEKCLFYLKNENRRNEIAIAGNKRCQTSGYSNNEAVKRMISIALK